MTSKEETLDVTKKLNDITNKIDNLDKKLNLILNFLQEDVKKNCDKMGEHIDFVENVYDNVKNPLGYLCNKLNYFSKQNTNYTLENLKEPEEDSLQLTQEEIDDIITSSDD